MDKHKTRLQEIALHHGIDRQKQKAIEELNELAVALAHGNEREIIEEMADCKIMLKQLELLYNIGEEISLEVDYKITRTMIDIKKCG